MNKLIFLFLFLSIVKNSQSQNVGIGTSTPAEKLDVNGNANISGQLKLNNNAGLAGQVLMKDASNNPVWGDLSEFKNIRFFDCDQISGAGGAGNCSGNWTVPAGVTKIFVECWGGGGGGTDAAGGAGGGYVSAKFNVVSGNLASIQIGAGGAPGNAANSGVASPGGTSFFSINGTAIFASGGGSDFSSGNNPNYTLSIPPGGYYLVSGLTDNFIGMGGSSGKPTTEIFSQVNSTTFAVSRYYGDGGDAALIPGSGTKGGFFQNYASTTKIVYCQPARQTGGGGGSDHSGGSNGKGGRIIIHY